DGDIGARFQDAAGIEPGDVFVAVIGSFWTRPRVAESHGGASDAELVHGAEGALDALRRHLGDVLGLRDPDQHAWA
ncbi:MAG: hypothetical protein GWM90_19005, partial [Gemmatimonadetes bacterium]|nr:hypothetical protein [Gemmatimonadota bacterium]NIQ56480.1 hypothetical protein [Gemmatimonadota bacterium]NIU76668.1 hypothetical protein [Gammaproteobacteria bacterium]NIX46103.1 hypothetical protein [Gemmatimonadota bacterium]NIY10418.1 hypothetical protein [Gemmatimonadota bacterium]